MFPPAPASIVIDFWFALQVRRPAVSLNLSPISIVISCLIITVTFIVRRKQLKIACQFRIWAWTHRRNLKASVYLEPGWFEKWFDDHAQ